MTEFDNPADRPLGVNLTTLERMLSLGGPALRPALIAQVLADLARLRGALAADQPATIRYAAHELKGIASTIGAESLAETAAQLDQELEHDLLRDRDAGLGDLCRKIDDLAALLRAESQRVPVG